MLASNHRELLDKVNDGLFIAGKWQPAAYGKSFTVKDPATGDVVKSTADASVKEAIRALDAAVAAQQEWAATASRQRSEILRRAFELLHERREDFAMLLSLEMGKPISQSRDEVDYGGEFLRWFSEEANRVRGDYRPNPEGTGTIMVSHLPVGPTYFITPWNFPLAMAARKIAPALAAGCTVVIKPAELTPLTSAYFVQLLIDAGVPAGVVNFVPTTEASEQSQALLSDRRLRKLSFTGSTAVGIHLMQIAAQNVVQTSMELGGNAPFIVFEDANLQLAVDGAVHAKFRNTGQACTAANRVLVHESVADEFAQRVVQRVKSMRIGHGTDEGTDIGALINDKAITNIARLVQDAVDTGGKILTGGKRIEGTGLFFQPTVIDDIGPEAAVMHEEIFGPVLAITRFSSEDEAVKIANNTEYGLTSYVYTENIQRGHRMVEKLETGMMGLNTAATSNAAAPFGGIKQSGIGKEGGFEGIHEFLSTKYTLLPRQ